MIKCLTYRVCLDPNEEHIPRFKEHDMMSNLSGYQVPVWQTPDGGLATKLGTDSDFRFLRRPEGSTHLVGSIVPEQTPLIPVNTQAKNQMASLFDD